MEALGGKKAKVASKRNYCSHRFENIETDIHKYLGRIRLHNRVVSTTTVVIEFRYMGGHGPVQQHHRLAEAGGADAVQIARVLPVFLELQRCSN